MDSFVIAVRAAVTQRNWYAALSLALTLPDICGRLENPAMASQRRFVAWYDKFLLSRYQQQVGAYREIHTFLSGNDCYALRCAFLHQGEFGIDDQRARQALEKFRFTEPPPVGVVHKNQWNDTLQLQVDVFCIDVCEAVEEWLAAVADKGIQASIAQLAKIDPCPKELPF